MFRLLKCMFYFYLLLSILSCSKKAETHKQSNNEEYTRIIELQNPYINGNDILALQQKLLSLGFYELGEADSYYSTITESVIKNIQAFSGFAIDGKVNKILWDYIFSEINDQFLENISTILSYNNIELENTGNIYNNEGLDFSIEAFVYYSLTNRNVRIVQYNRYDYRTDISCTYYFINDKYYFVKQEFSDERFFDYLYYEGIDPTIIDRIMIIEDNIQYEVINGTKVASNTNYFISITETIENIMNTFNEYNVSN